MSATPTRAVVAALIRKDLRRELRTQESLPAMALFSVTTFVLFHFGLDARSLEGDLAAGVFWVTMLFAAVLAINRQFVAEREEGGFDGFLMAPVDRTALFVAKAIVLFGFLVAVELVAVPAFVVLLLEPGPGQALPELLAVLLLGQLVWAMTRIARTSTEMGLDVGADQPAASSVRLLGRVLFTDYMFAFEVTSILIIAAMVGAVVLAGKKGN